MINQYLEGHSPPTEDTTPSAEGVASVHGVQTSISPQVLTKDSRPPPLSHQYTAEMSSLVKLIPAVTAMPSLPPTPTCLLHLPPPTHQPTPPVCSRLSPKVFRSPPAHTPLPAALLQLIIKNLTFRKFCASSKVWGGEISALTSWNHY